jgi:hypothetical protein
MAGHLDPAERRIQFIEAHPVAAGGLVRQVLGQRRAVLKVGEIIDVDNCGDWLAVLANGDRTVALPRLGDKLTQVGLSRRQRICRGWTVTLGSAHCGQEHTRPISLPGCGAVAGRPFEDQAGLSG